MSLTGTGGAGNYRRYKAEDITPGATATGPASRISLSKSSKRQPVLSGRGGAGNYKASEAEERVFQFDEEMVKKRELQAPVYHIGRGKNFSDMISSETSANYIQGGAGNWADVKQQPRTERLNSTASALSSGSDGSESDSNARRSESTFSKIARRFS